MCGLYTVAMSFCLSVCLFICLSVVWNVCCCWRHILATQTTDVPDVSFPWETTPFPSEIYANASGGGLLVAPACVPHLLNSVITILYICWTGRGVGGCHLLANGTGLNTGFVVGPPVAVSDNTLVIRYKSGDVCSLPSTAKLYRSTTVMFHCSLQQVCLRVAVVNDYLNTIWLISGLPAYSTLCWPLSETTRVMFLFAGYQI